MTPPIRVRMSRRLHATTLLAALLAAVAPATAAEQVVPAAREAMLILKGECFPCHNERKRKGGLVLTSRDALLRGNESGPAAEAGRPEESAIIRVIAHDADPQMPPDRPLTDAQRKTLRDWVASGLPWDDDALTKDELRPVQLASLPTGYHPVLALALSDDGKRLAVGRGGEIVIHDTTAKDFREVGRTAEAGDAVQSLAWSPDGRWLASGGFRRVVRRDAASLAVAHELSDGLAGRVTALRFSPDSRLLALAEGVTGRSGIVRLIDATGGRVTAAWTAHDDTVFALDFSRDGARLATAGGDRLVKIWDPATHAEVARLEGHGAPVHAVAFNADGTQLASGGADRELNVWDTATREKIISLGAPASAVNAVCWPGDGAKLLAATATSGVHAYTNLKVHPGGERAKGGDERKLGEPGDAVLCLTANADASLVFAGAHDGSVTVWDGAGKQVARLQPTGGAAVPPAAVEPVSFLRDVLPALTRAGCSTGGCHAKAEGQNGFRLSVFTYDPRGDFDAIVKGARGRRVFPAAPEESLVIRKPTGALDHEGGRRFDTGSELHRLLTRWMSEGMVYRAAGEPDLTRIEVTPREGSYRRRESRELRVEARYADGSKRDVTHLAAYAANDPEVAAVDENGRMQVGVIAGEAVVVARYMGLVADSRITVPAEGLLPSERYANLPRNNFIDELAQENFRRLGLLPSAVCTDAEFLRRAKLDTIGVLPTPAEVRAFLADPSPDKRRRVIGEILGHPAYADHWATKWADLVRPNPDRVGLKSVLILDQWLRQSFRENQPYDRFVSEILLAEGTNHRDGPAVIYRDRREPAERATMFAQLFLGTRLDCARCHNHPNEKWTQADFTRFAAFFSGVKQKGAGLSPPISAGTETFYHAPGGVVKHPVTGEVMAPRPLDGPHQPGAKDEDPRQSLVASLLHPDNPYFAVAAVNRVWAAFFGRGFVEPVDDFRISNPAAQPALLTALARDFVARGYDLKHLMRVIMESSLYQLSSEPNETNLADTRNFSRAYRRRLPAEVLLDAVNDASGGSDTFAGMPPGSRAVQAWSYKIESQFMDAFSRPDPSMDPPCERDAHLSVVQSLHLMNSKGLQGKLSAPGGRARRLADRTVSPAEIVTELYLATLSRPPQPAELAIATAAFTAPGATRVHATEDVLWALLNSAEFVFNH